MMLSNKIFLVCLTLAVIAVCDAKSKRKSVNKTDRKSEDISVSQKKPWPSAGATKCEAVSTIDTGYTTEATHNWGLATAPYCGVTQFYYATDESRLMKYLRNFQDYLSELQLPNEETRLSRKLKVNSNLDSRIVGGKPADIGRWPWLAAVGKYGASSVCTASILRENFLVTAASCFKDMEKPCEYNVRAGTTDWLNGPEGSVQDQEVLAIYRHPEYDAKTHANDIALIQLKTPLNTGEVYNVSAICFPNEGRDVTPGTLLYVAGWGKQASGKASTTDTKARVVGVPLITYDENNCGEHPVETMLDGMLCAGYVRGGKGTCLGDEGAPLIYKRGEQWFQLGIASAGATCGGKGYPGVYTDIGQYNFWLGSCVMRHDD